MLHDIDIREARKAIRNCSIGWGGFLATSLANAAGPEAVKQATNFAIDWVAFSGKAAALYTVLQAAKLVWQWFLYDLLKWVFARPWRSYATAAKRIAITIFKGPPL